MFDPARFPVEEFLSEPRLRRYRSRSASDTEAFRLYFWNQELAAAFLGPLSVLEIALRNAIHSALSAEYGEDWILSNDALPLLDDDRSNFNKTIGRLEDILSKRNESVTPNAVVGSSSLGDWVRLLDKGESRSSSYNYEKTLWEPALINAFPHKPKEHGRKNVHDEFNRIRSFRNRVVHHEPIFHRNVRSMMNDIIDAASWIHRDAGEVIKHGNCLNSVLNSREVALSKGECCL